MLSELPEALCWMRRASTRAGGGMHAIKGDSSNCWPEEVLPGVRGGVVVCGVCLAGGVGCAQAFRCLAPGPVARRMPQPLYAAAGPWQRRVGQLREPAQAATGWPRDVKTKPGESFHASYWTCCVEFRTTRRCTSQDVHLEPGTVGRTVQ